MRELERGKQRSNIRTKKKSVRIRNGRYSNTIARTTATIKATQRSNQLPRANLIHRGRGREIERNEKTTTTDTSLTTAQCGK